MYFKILVIFMAVAIVCVQSKCTSDVEIDITEGTRIHKTIKFKNVTYQEQYYYINETSNKVMGCVCDFKICVYKCCPLNMIYNTSNQCVHDDKKFIVPLYDMDLEKTDKTSDDMNFYFLEKGFNHVLDVQEAAERRGEKTVNSFANADFIDNWKIRQDGQLWVEMTNRVPSFEYHTPDTYCIDTFVYEENGLQKHELNALVCFNEDKDNHHYVLSIVCMYISCFFILLTLAVYAWLPELRNLHGKVLMGYLGSFFCAFTLLATFQLFLVTKISALGTGSCIFFTFVPYFFLEAAFFWMNVMCFDIYWTFCGKRGMSIERVSTNTRFRKYALYAFGCPLALTILVAILEYSHLPPSDYLPNLAKLGCFLFGTSKLIYLYGPITLLLIVNLIFFVLTSIEIYRINSGMKPFLNKGKDSSTHDKTRKDTHRLLLYVKLFCVMGINWILEVISSIYPDLNNIWIYTDAYNVLVGVIIFIIFVCKKKMFNLMKKRIKHNIEERHSESNNTIRLTNSNRFKLNTKKGSIDTIQTSVTDTESIKPVKTNYL